MYLRITVVTNIFFLWNKEDVIKLFFIETNNIVHVSKKIPAKPVYKIFIATSRLTVNTKAYITYLWPYVGVNTIY